MTLLSSCAASAAAAGGAREVMEVVVTEVVDASEFYVQRTSEPRVAWIAEQLRAAGEAEGPAIPVSAPRTVCVLRMQAEWVVQSAWRGSLQPPYIEPGLNLASLDLPSLHHSPSSSPGSCALPSTLWTSSGTAHTWRRPCPWLASTTSSSLTSATSKQARW